MWEISVRLNDDAYRRLLELSRKYGFDPTSLVEKMINEILVYETDVIEEYIDHHDYGDMSGEEKVLASLIDLIELGAVTFNSVEAYVLEALGAKGYWLEDYGIDLIDRSIWMLFTGSGIVEEFTIGADPDGISLVAIHSIDDLITQDPSIEQRIIDVIEGLETDYDVAYDDGGIRVAVRAGSIDELPGINDIAKVIGDILSRAGVDPGSRARG